MSPQPPTTFAIAGLYARQDDTEDTQVSLKQLRFRRAPVDSATVTEQGFVGSHGEWHRTAAGKHAAQIRSGGQDTTVNERAVLVQIADAHETATGDKIAEVDPKASWGENILLVGPSTFHTHEDVCIGDRFTSSSGLVLEVASPRKPCAEVDVLLGKGSRRRSAATGTAGIFCRVLTPGCLSREHSFTHSRPNGIVTEWTLERTSSLIYGDATHPKYPIYKPTVGPGGNWTAARVEMERLLRDAPGFAMYAWGDEIRRGIREEEAQRSQTRCRVAAAFSVAAAALGVAVWMRK